METEGRDTGSQCLVRTRQPPPVPSASKRVCLKEGPGMVGWVELVCSHKDCNSVIYLVLDAATMGARGVREREWNPRE